MSENIKPSDPTIQKGWTLRDEFAKTAMGTILGFKHYDGQQKHELNTQGYLNSYWDSETTQKEMYEAEIQVINDAENIAKRAYLMADAMLKQREL